MRVLLQRVSHASVTVDGEVSGAIGPGLLLLLGIAEGDGQAEIDLLAGKIANLRIFEDAEGKMNRSLLDLLADDVPEAGALVVSQFTLYADVRKGRRPSFVGAAGPATAEPMVTRFGDALTALGVPVAYGVFGAHMQVSLLNDGPVTIWLDSDELGRPRRGGSGDAA
ncbi:MAG: D-aminoacyl-tRNA deacylase [Thermomicrobiales bacterium]